MPNTDLKFNQKNNSVTELLEAIRQGIPSAVFGVPESFKNYLVSQIENQVLYLVKDSLTAMQAVKIINEFSNKRAVYLPPKDETLVNVKAFSKNGVYQRLQAIYQIPTAQVVVVTPQSLLQPISKKVNLLKIEKDGDYDLTNIVKTLVDYGYQRREQCAYKGPFSLRGDVLDVFPINQKNAFRIDFFGDTAQSIREFDAETTKTIEFINSVEILQAVECVLNGQDIESILQVIDLQVNNAKGDNKLKLSLIKEDINLAVENKDYDALSLYLSLTESVCPIYELFTKQTVVIINEGKRVYETCQLVEREFVERLKSLSEVGEAFSCLSGNCLSLDQVVEDLHAFMQVGVQTLSSSNPFFNPLKIINPSVSGVANYQLAFSELFTDTDNWLKSGYSVLIHTADSRRSDRLCMDFSTKGIASSIDKTGEFTGVNIISRSLSDGFVFHEQKTVVIGSGNLYAKLTKTKPNAKRTQTFFSAPEVGDYCVHETHGLGKVLGNRKISTTEGTKDYVCVEYSGGDLLYIPVEQMDILTRYLGSEKHPKLSRIGGKDFERVKKAVKESIKKMSFDLKRLYLEREEQKGFAFINEPELQSVFDGAFPYELTPDQQTADQEILDDMTSKRVMDRLVCGDVGFGKTEVAFRAVFRAIANGKQVAFVAPTTILTEQHFNTAKERFKDFGVKIACLNRFKTPKQQREIVQGLKDGTIDLVIGTHRLFSKDIQFKDLGLLVLDEEQRFGVEHKEKIKLLKKNVDALTLTATPIPRTLHMSLSGIRSISTINTPPKKRLPVQTYVTEETDMLIKDAITREVNRGGQAFILYNRVESIYTFADKISTLMPNLKITVCHGQMEERVLERNILGFYRGESDVLISTTIIENGIDLPKANTLVVIDADRLGLSTLYQIKGRVGRSDRLAYAYFTYKRDKVLTGPAFERLNAIIEFAEMGSGIKIAVRDLEIRGAGNILGAEQHGHMDKIGYELYSKLLKEELSGEQDVMPELDIRITAFIPDDYIENSTVRMDVYKEIAEMTDLDSKERIINSLEDTFGKIPEETLNLISIAMAKRMASKLKVKEITVKSTETSLTFSDFMSMNNPKLLTAIDCFGSRVKLDMSQMPKIVFRSTYADNAEMMGVITEFLTIAVK